MKPGLHNCLTVTTKVTTHAVRHWDRKLTQRDEQGHPLFPLAPQDLRRMQNLTEDQYQAENARYGRACNQYVEQELQRMEQDIGRDFLQGGLFTVLGLGLGRDLEWIHTAKQLGLRGEFYDLSTVALRNLHDLLYRFDMEKQSMIFQEEITGQHIPLSHDSFMVYAGNFVQVLGVGRMRKVLRRLGTFLDQPERRVILVHPFPEDNEGVEWGDTTPYPLATLITSAEKGLGRKVQVYRPEKISYFHHTYTIFTLETQ